MFQNFERVTQVTTRARILSKPRSRTSSLNRLPCRTQSGESGSVLISAEWSNPLLDYLIILDRAGVTVELEQLDRGAKISIILSCRI
jgi:hypothetical protein